MFKSLLSFTVLLAFALMTLTSCGSDNNKKVTDSTMNDSIVVESDEDYSDVVFNSPQNVMEFIHFKRFEDSHGFVAFNGKGGVIADEAFNTDSVIVKDKKSAEIFISVPKMKMTGTLLLKVEEKRVILVDEETKADYKLVN
ncbi:MAG: hypothetical protein K2H18_06225 [Muribaculaceae bacterium]|nr:hypothetical protein [Muribaculaceae bacterium]